MTQYNELIALHEYITYHRVTAPQVLAAADAIERLEAEMIARQVAHYTLFIRMRDAEVERDALQAEVERLTKITQAAPFHNGNSAKHWNELAVHRYHENCALEAQLAAAQGQTKTRAEECRGYALLGTGQYCIEHTLDFDHELGAELLITLATDEDKSGNRQVGESRDNPEPGKPIQPEDMVIRIGFLSGRGLFALEDQLACIRKLHFAATQIPQQVAEPVNAMLVEALEAAEKLEHEALVALSEATYELKVGNTYTTATDTYKSNNDLIHRLDKILNSQYRDRKRTALAAAQQVQPEPEPAPTAQAPDCRTCVHLRDCELYTTQCTNGDKYQPTPFLGLWKVK